MRRCNYAGCKTPAECNIIWGNSRQQQANLCCYHIDLLWDSVKAAVAHGSSYWIQSDVKDDDNDPTTRS